ncbi:MAG TPA: alpha/beta hydrolase [Candidatus Paceibacterota bacterium]|nr:alpha/beta hydrolase [Candidatus Paceibacterota bacterium]
MKTVVFTHGMWERNWIFKNFAKECRKYGYPTKFINLPDQKNGSETLARIEDRVEYIVSQIVSLEKIILIGHSLGGLLSIGASLHPSIKDRVEKIVLLNSAPLGRSFLSFEVLKRIWRYLPKLRSDSTFELRYEDAFALELKHVEDPHQVYAQMTEESGVVARQMALWQYLPDTKQVPCPVLVIGAQNDQITPPRIQRKNVRLLPNALYKEFPGGHMLPIEPLWPAVARDIQKFLEGN